MSDFSAENLTAPNGPEPFAPRREEPYRAATGSAPAAATGPPAPLGPTGQAGQSWRIAWTALSTACGPRPITAQRQRASCSTSPAISWASSQPPLMGSAEPSRPASTA